MTFPREGSYCNQEFVILAVVLLNIHTVYLATKVSQNPFGFLWEAREVQLES